MSPSAKAITAALAVLLMAGCGPAAIKAGNTTPPPSATATRTSDADSAVCQDVAALHASVDRLLSYQPGKNTIASLKNDLSDATTKLVALRQSAHGTLATQTGPLATALRDAQGTVSAAVGTGQVAGIVRALGGVRAKSETFFAAAKAECPSTAA